MFRITFALGGLEDRELALGAFATSLDALVKTDMVWLSAHRGTPSPYDLLRSGRLRYEDEPQGPKPPGREDWQDVPTVLGGRRDGSMAIGNRDLAAWRVAELRGQGVPAVLTVQSKGSELRAVVKLPDGRLEDQVPKRGFRRIGPHQRFSFVVDLFNGPADRSISDQTLLILLYALTDIDEAYLRKHPETPTLYQSKVRYVEEPPGQEDWQDVPTCLRMGRADCDDLAPWLAAERRVRQNLLAYPIYRSKPLKGGSVMYHIQTKVGSRIEDPSWVVGMQ